MHTFLSIRTRLADCFQLLNASKPVSDVLMNQFLALGSFDSKRVITEKNIQNARMAGSLMEHYLLVLNHAAL